MSNVPTPPLIPADRQFSSVQIDNSLSISQLSISTVQDYKMAVRVATVSAGTLATSFVVGQTVDTIVLVLGDRILVKNQASGIENGIFTVNVTGEPTRSGDLSLGVSASNVVVFVGEGASNAGSGFECTNAVASDIVGTSALVFDRFTSAGVKKKLDYAAGNTTAITSTAGKITTAALSTATTASTTITLTGPLILATSQIMLTMVSYSATYITAGIPILSVSSVVAGTATLLVTNAGANVMAGTVVFNYQIL